MDGVAITAILAGTGGIITLFIKYITGRDKAQEKRDQIFTEALASNTKAMVAVAESSEKVARETAKGNREAKQRNGHLAEISVTGNQGIMDGLAVIKGTLDTTAEVLIKSNEKFAEGTQEVAKALKDKDSVQLIDQQTVVHQTVKNKE